MLDKSAVIRYARDKIENEYVKVYEEIEEDGTQNRDTLIRDRRKLDFSVKMGRLGDQMAKCAGVVVVGTPWNPQQMAGFCSDSGGQVD